MSAPATLYQGRFKSFPVQEDDHFLALCRYVERNALRAGLVRERAEDWLWGSLARRLLVADDDLLSPWPVACPTNWAEWVNEPQSDGELQAIRRSVKRGQPFGSEGWVQTTARRLHLEQTLRRQGRPSKPRPTRQDQPEQSLFD